MYVYASVLHFVTSSELNTAQDCLLLDNTGYYSMVLELEESIEIIKIKNLVKAGFFYEGLKRHNCYLNCSHIIML